LPEITYGSDAVLDSAIERRDENAAFEVADNAAPKWFSRLNSIVFGVMACRDPNRVERVLATVGEALPRSSG